ncbi:MAG: hypothetical protein ASARMPREDX12_004802 [Alectoria sarmentosa]|nr:MAG: hypothetical protein ASARMPRED_008011 [Alectoria sarmentosa]CAD6590950.1 MAG: hypothetical protein ASARMPREDX12_004802 [Alectoria sarmentosa]
MPTYAILGVTGSTGSSLLRYLHERPEKVNINLYARSASKVESLHPYVKTAETIQSFVGDLSSAELLKDCLRNVDVIFSAVAQNSNEPGCSIARRTAHSIVSALDALRKEEGSSFKCPILVFLSSASLNPTFSGATPWLLHWVLERGCYYIYGDLRESIEYLKEQSWIPLITAEPPALTQDISRGYELSLHEVMPGISYDDLARGMVQMAEEDGGHKWVGKGVGIKATGSVKIKFLPLIWYLVVGLIAYFSPPAWGVLQRAGLAP